MQNSSHLHSLCVGILFNCTFCLGNSYTVCKTSQLYNFSKRLSGVICLSKHAWVLFQVCLATVRSPPPPPPPPSGIFQVVCSYAYAHAINKGNPNMSGNTRGWIGFSSSGKGKTKNIVPSSKKREGRIQNFVKQQTATMWMLQGFLLSHPIDYGYQ